MSSFISQDYFDELCVENYEVFEMSCKEEAVTETRTQLQSRQVSTLHLSLTYPDNEATGIRSQIRGVQAALRILENADDLDKIQQSLDIVHLAFQDEQESNLFSNLFMVEQGCSIYFSLFARLGGGRWNGAISTLLSTLQDLVRNSAQFRTPFQTAAPLAMPASLNMFEQELLQSTWNEPRVTLLLSTVYASVVRCEANKKLWMQTRTETSSFASLMLDILKRVTSTIGKAATVDIGCTVCRILTALCTFDDFRADENTATPVIQSGHTHVQTLAEEGAVVTVHQFLLLVETNTDSSSAAVSALRAMGIQDDIVQCMEKIGVLETASRLLREAIDSTETKQQQPLISSILGLFRNVAANDDIKTTLCTGKHQAVVGHMIQAMQLYPAVALLQEHACGLTAAMALRKPKNAAALVGAGAHLQIVTAMEQHPAAVTLQRQAALALRNLVARSPELRAAVLDSPVEEALRTIAAKHLGCQDEVYAALRDLGLKVTSVQVQHLDDGKMTVQEGRQMFGERNPNFRPVYDE